jgi:anti-sigma factor (TIGR02949 family)
MISCEQVVQGVWEFLDKDMTPEAIATFQKHLDLCRSCFSKIEFEKMLRVSMQAKTDCKCPEKLKAKIQGIIELF